MSDEATDGTVVDEPVTPDPQSEPVVAPDSVLPDALPLGVVIL